MRRYVAQFVALALFGAAVGLLVVAVWRAPQAAEPVPDVPTARLIIGDWAADPHKPEGPMSAQDAIRHWCAATWTDQHGERRPVMKAHLRAALCGEGAE